MDQEDKSKSDSKKQSYFGGFQRLRVDRRSVRRKLSRAETVSQRHAHRFIIKRVNSLRESRKQIVGWLSLVCVIIAGIAVQGYISGQKIGTSQSTSGGVFVEGVVGDINTLNPLYASSAPEVSASRLMFSSLYNYDDTGALRMDLAKSITINDTGTLYTVKLKDAVKWHDGEELNAEDVIFTIDTIKNPQSRVRSSLRANWVDISAKLVDEKTVEFRLPLGYAAFVHALTFPVMPKHLLSEINPGALQESAFSRSPIGSGPFTYRLLQAIDVGRKHKSLHLTANQDYFKGEPKLARFELAAYESSNSLASAAKAQEVTAAADVTLEQVNELDGFGYSVDSYSLDNGVYAILNTTSQNLSDVDVRKAIQTGVDTNLIVKSVGSNVKELYLPFIANQVDKDVLPAKPKFDVEAAKKTLDEAGWKMDKGVRKKGDVQLRLRLATTTNEQYRAAAENFAEQLRGLGITIDLEVADVSNPSVNFVTNVLQPRDFDILVYELPIGADPDVYAYWHSSQLGVSGYNFANYSNKSADALLLTARDRSDNRLRSVKYGNFAKQWLNDVPAIGLYQQVVNYAIDENAEAMRENSSFVINSDRYADVQLWSSQKATVYKTP